jgi:membrane protease YdiL (CAAX protease family)
MNKYYVILMIIRWSFLALLFVVPFIYSVWKGNFKKGFWFTWIVWSVVIFVYGMFVPAIAHLTEKATGEMVDSDGCFGDVIGIFIGWLPGLIIAPLGCFLHNLLFRKK